jgi:DNA-binding NarL/FixJ family response regulator
VSRAFLLDAIRGVAHHGGAMSPDIASKVLTMFRETASPRNAAHDLSPRELQILRLLGEGHGYKTAAAELSLSEETVRFHIRHIYAKLHVHSKSEAVIQAFRRGIIR